MRTDTDPDTKDIAPALRLSIAVVEQALADIQAYGRLTQTIRHSRWENDIALAKRRADDAREFLLTRLWEPSNPFGVMLQHFGARRFSRERLVHCVRNSGQS